MKTLITGSTSMIGTALLSGPFCIKNAIADNHAIYDLMNYDVCYNLINTVKPDHIIHLASLNGNIQYNNTYPANIFQTTSQIAYNVLTASSRLGVKKVVSAISSCAYPCADILEESNFFNGEPHPSIEAHGFAKRYIIELSRQLYRQHGFISVGMCFNTTYGPHDSFDLHKTKVMGSLIHRFVEARRIGYKEVILWGTGTPKREFIYVDDVARMFSLVLNKYNDPFYPINVGSGVEISIANLATIVAEIVGYDGKIIFDTSKPDGQMRKLLSNEKMQKYFGQQNFTALEDGIRRTVDWYVKSDNHYS